MLELIISDNEDTANELLIDGVPLTRESGEIDRGKENLWVRIYNYNLSKKITAMSIDEIPKEIHSLKLHYPLDFNEYFQNIDFFRDYDKDEFEEMNFTLSWDFEKWKKPYSIEEFALALKEVILEYEDEGIVWQEDEEFASNGCMISFRRFDKKETIRTEVERKMPIIIEIMGKVHVLLAKQSREDSIISLFDFPEQVRVPCEQYLVYFAEFLKNIGINATTDISHQAGRVLFSVTPESKEIALEQIREALQIYLQLPKSFAHSGFTNMQLEPREQQLLANIQHLNGQLMLANAIAYTQGETIQNQRDVIEQQRKIIDATILQQSLLIEAKDADSLDKEEILGGTVSLTNLEVKGFQINIPNIYRLLRDKIIKK